MSGGIAAIQARISAIQARFEPMGTAGGVLGPTSSPTADSARLTDGKLLSPTTSFTDALQSAMQQGSPRPGTTGTTGLAGLTAADLAGPRTPAARLSSYGRLEPPPELVAYGNGRIPKEALAEIGIGSHRLHAPAARAFRQMKAAAEADGVTIGITDSYRPYEVQVDLARRKGLYSQGGLAATPGTSNHGWGLAVDLDLDAKALAWMRANGPDFGFVEDTPREPWHWAYRPIR